jgi:hypothetical protein
MTEAPRKLTIDDARQSLTAHVRAKGDEIHRKYGPAIGWRELGQIIQDRDFVRYPCEIAFDATGLLPGEPAHAAAKGDRPEDGFILFVHPFFSLDPSRVPLLALYQLVVVNYGAFASSDDAEAFGSACLGLEPEAYYGALCEMADEIGGEP